MKTYLDDNYLILDNILVSYFSNDTKVKVPGKMGHRAIKKIGRGALAELTMAERIVLDYGIEEIGEEAFRGSGMKFIEIPGSVKKIEKNAFHNCPQLQEITFYDLEIKKAEYEEFKKKSIRTLENLYISGQAPSFMEKNIQEKIPYTMCRELPYWADAIFMFRSDSFGKTLRGLICEAEKFTLKGDVGKNEMDSFLSLSSDYGRQAAGADKIFDNAVFRKKGGLFKPKLMIYTVDDTKVKTFGDNVHLSVCLKIGFYFWQSSKKVIMNRKEYYVYRRMYITAGEYVREDVCIFREGRVVTDREEAKMVYGKYKLLSIL